MKRRPKRRAIRRDPQVLLAIRQYRDAGLTQSEISARLRISAATFYRCVADLENLKAEARPEGID
jgi:DNA-binding IclR family transcriptional regulator